MRLREPACAHNLCALAFVCVREHEKRCGALPALPASAQWHSEEPGGDKLRPLPETAATCHISLLKFGGNQFGTLIRWMTPTPAVAEGPRPMVSPPHPFPPCKRLGIESRGTQVINLKSPPPN